MHKLIGFGYYFHSPIQAHLSSTYVNWNPLFWIVIPSFVWFLWPLQDYYPRLLGDQHTYHSLWFWSIFQWYHCNSKNASPVFLLRWKERLIKLKTNFVNLSVSIVFDSRLSTQWQRITSLSNSLMRICRKAFSISLHSNIGLKLDLVRISPN